MSRPPGLPKTGGRQKGTPNKLQITDAMRKDILSCYRKLGGVRWLFSWAAANESEFIKQCLSRVMPAPPREEPSVVVNTGPQVNVDELSDLQIASRIAFALQTFAAERLEPQGRVIEGATMPAPPPEAMKPPKPAHEPTPAPTPEPPAAASETEQREIAHFGSGAEQGTRRRSLL